MNDSSLKQPKPPPVVYFDTRRQLPEFAWRAVLLTAQWGPTILVKPKDDGDLESANLSIIDPSEIVGLPEEIQYFRSVYVHMSTAPLEYERACFERFIALNALCAQWHLPSIWHVDTDVVAGRAIFEGPINEWLSSVDLVAWGAPAHPFSFGQPLSVGFSYVKREVLQAFAAFVTNGFFTNYLHECESFYQGRVAAGLTGGVCDMTAWGVLWNGHPEWIVIDSRRERLGSHSLINTLYTFSSRPRDVAPALTLKGKGRYVLAESDGDFRLERGNESVPLIGVHFAGADKGLITNLEPHWRLPIGGKRHVASRLRYRARRKIASMSASRA